jgi:membrane protease YdiL (CAAX protease family)
LAKIRDLAEVLAWSALAYLLATSSSPIIVFTLGAVYGDPAAAPASVLQNLIYVSPVFPLILGVLAIARLKLGGDNVWRRIGLFGKTLPRDVLIGAAAGVVCIGLALVSLRIAAHYVDVPPMHLLPPPVHVYFMTIGALVPGVCEELFFRGMLMRVGTHLPKAVLIILTAAAFSVWHVGTPAYLPHTFLLGLIFGVFATVTGRLAPSIIAHTIANAGMGLLLLSGFNTAGQ